MHDMIVATPNEGGKLMLDALAEVHVVDGRDSQGLDHAHTDIGCSDQDDNVNNDETEGVVGVDRGGAMHYLELGDRAGGMRSDVEVGNKVVAPNKAALVGGNSHDTLREYEQSLSVSSLEA